MRQAASAWQWLALSWLLDFSRSRCGVRALNLFESTRASESQTPSEDEHEDELRDDGLGLPVDLDDGRLYVWRRGDSAEGQRGDLFPFDSRLPDSGARNLARRTGELERVDEAGEKKLQRIPEPDPDDLSDGMWSDITDAAGTDESEGHGPRLDDEGEEDGDDGSREEQQQDEQAHWDAVMARNNRFANSAAKHGRKKPVVRLKTRMVVPDLKLAFCYIPKVGSAMFTKLFDELNFVSNGSSHSQRSAPGAMKVMWANVTHENGWKFAYFTRDPLMRYASAFGSKCMVSNQGVVEGMGADCKGKILWEPSSLPTVVKTFEERVMEDMTKGRPADNMHWYPQARILKGCSWDRFHPKKVDFRGTLDGDVHSQVIDMLRLVGEPRAEALAEKYFPVSNISGHTSDARNLLETFYTNTTIMEAVANLYRFDYTQLKLPVPKVAAAHYNS